MRVRHRKALCRDKSGACFRGFLRCSRYSSYRREKLSKTGEFYLHYLARMQSSCLVVFVRRCLSYRARRFESAWYSVFCACAARRLFCARCAFRSASGALVMRITLHSSCAVGIDTVCVASALANAARFGNPCIALHVAGRRRLKFYVRRLTPHLAPPLEISCEVVCASFDAIAKHPRITCFARVIEHSKTEV